jgi:TonB family protein
MTPEPNKSTSISPLWLLIPAVLGLLFVAALVGAGVTLYRWQAQRKELSREREVRPPVAPGTPSPRTAPAPVDVDEPPPPPKPRNDVPRTVSGGVLNGKAISLPKPTYPAVARAVKASGSVVVQITIDEDGNVISASAISGHPLLRASAVTAARSSKFSPTLLGGQPVKVTGTIVYNFAP